MPLIRPGRSRGPVLVEVFTRQSCGLCEHAEAQAAREAGGEDLRLVDVDADPDLQRRYHVRVPVVAVDGDEVAEGHLQPGAVRKAVRRARRRRRWQGRARSG
jgi:glutaredoxin